MNDLDFLAAVSARLSPAEHRVKTTLERVKQVYVTSGRDKVASDQLSGFVTNMLSMRGQRRDDGRMFFVTGDSGAGKTSLVRRMLERNAVLQPMQTPFGQVSPLISITLMGPVTLRFLGLNILRQAGYAITRKLEQGEVWDLLPSQLHQRKVLLIHIDETQHILKLAASDRERDSVTKALKGVTNYEAWPVSFVMSGMPEAARLAKFDEQIERRGEFLALPDIIMPDERPLVEKIISKMAEAAPIDCAAIMQSDVPERIAHAARYRFGRIAQVVLAGIEQAAQRDSTALTRDHFALAYLEHSQARGHDTLNPFLADNWRRLDPGSFLFEGPEPHE